MVTKITVGPAKEEYLSPIKLLITELWEAMTDTGGFDIGQAIENLKKLKKEPGHHMLVARKRDVVIGFVTYTTRNTLMHARPSGLIDELVVAHASRGSGVGKRLMQAVIDECREIGCSEVEVSTEKSNLRARRFYKANGFKEHAVFLEINL